MLCACGIIQLFPVEFCVVRPGINLTLGLLLRKNLTNGDRYLFNKLHYVVTGGFGGLGVTC